MAILWWCWPPAIPRPPGCFRCLPMRPWPALTWPRFFLFLLRPAHRGHVKAFQVQVPQLAGPSLQQNPAENPVCRPPAWPPPARPTLHRGVAGPSAARRAAAASKMYRSTAPTAAQAGRHGCIAAAWPVAIAPLPRFPRWSLHGAVCSGPHPPAAQPALLLRPHDPPDMQGGPERRRQLQAAAGGDSRLVIVLTSQRQSQARRRLKWRCHCLAVPGSAQRCAAKNRGI